jgi:hypothetical protein
MDKKAKILLFASELASGELKIASREDQIKIARLIIKTAMDARAFGSAGPMLAQQFIIGAVSKFDKTTLGASQRDWALASLADKFPRLKKRENEANLKKIEDTISLFLQKKFSKMARQFGINALESAYTQLILEMPVYKWADKNNASITTTTVNGLIKELQAALSTIIRGDVIDAIRTQKRQQELAEGAGSSTDYVEDYQDIEGGDDLLSQRAPTSLSPKMREDLLSLIDNDQFITVSEAVKTLKVTSLSSARLFAEAIRGCNIFSNPSKIPSTVREDLAVAAVVLRYTIPGADIDSRGGSYQNIVDFLLEEDRGDASKYLSLVAQKIDLFFRQAGVSAVNAEGVASYLVTANNPVDRMEAYVDQAYTTLTKSLVKVEMNIDDNAISGSCKKALVALSDEKELRRIRYRMDAHGIDFTR